MTSDEIKKLQEDNVKFIKESRGSLELQWKHSHDTSLLEIAYQLAVLNERNNFENFAAHSRATRRGQVIETLRNRVDELLNANNAEVERRRKVEKELQETKDYLQVVLNLPSLAEPAVGFEPPTGDIFAAHPFHSHRSTRFCIKCGAGYFHSIHDYEEPTGTADDSIPQPVVEAVREHLAERSEPKMDAVGERDPKREYRDKTLSQALEMRMVYCFHCGSPLTPHMHSPGKWCQNCAWVVSEALAPIIQDAFLQNFKLGEPANG